MNTGRAIEKEDQHMHLGRSVVTLVLGLFGSIALFVGLLFPLAGRLDWLVGWAYLGLLFFYLLMTWICLLRWNPVLIQRRMRIGAGTKRWDYVWAFVFTPLFVAVYLVAGWDAADGKASLSSWVWPIGLIVFCPGGVLLTSSMVVNPFFEKTVRIQTEHGHHVIDHGPYAYVRHPGYSGFGCWLIAAPLLLLSAPALIPAVLAVATLVARTSLEDRTLQAELPGYTAYAERVPYRLLPGIW